MVGIALVLADLRIAWFLNSFYQESLAYVAIVLFACALHRLFQSESPLALTATLATLVLLAAAKFAFALSALAIALVLLAAYAARGRVRATLPAGIGVVAIGIAAAVAFVVRSAPELQRQHVAYNFLFNGALHAVPDGDRGDFLEAIGVPARFASELGKTAYDVDSRFADPELSGALGARTQLHAILRLAATRPLGLVELLRGSLRVTGVYDIERHAGYGTRIYGAPARTAPSIHLWSDLRDSALGSELLLALTIVLGAALLALAVVRNDEPLLLWYGAATIALVTGSLVQVVFAVVGNGYLDLHKHLYVGGVLLDLAFLLAAVGAGVAIANRRRAPEASTARSS
jgi:hypothetical protein